MKRLSTQGRAALKLIVIGGVLTFLLLFWVSLSLKKQLQPNPRQKVVLRQRYSPFEHERAWRDMEALLKLGPRPIGSEAALQQRNYLAREVQAAGLRIRKAPFTVSGAPLVNLIAMVEGSLPETIILCTHCNTPSNAPEGYVGAQRDTSGAAWLLEMARALGPKRMGASVWCVWLEGNPGMEDAPLAGAEALLQMLQQEKERTIKAIIAISAIGDCFLQVHRTPNESEWLANALWGTAQRLNYGRHFSHATRKLNRSVWTALRQAALPTALLSDFAYGGSVLEHKNFWNHPNDTLDKLCPESLQAVADVLYHALPIMDSYAASISVQYK